jgi:hypothetical protein
MWNVPIRSTSIIATGELYDAGRRPLLRASANPRQLARLPGAAAVRRSEAGNLIDGSIALSEDAVVDSPSFVVVLLGLPGTGKFTIAKELRGQYERSGRDVRVIDNHYTANVVFGVLPLVDGYRSIPPETWEYVGKVRAAVWDAIIALSSPQTSFVFTSDITNREGPAHAEQYRRLADSRDSVFVPVRLLCEVDELARRIVSPERRDRSKWLDSEGVRRKHAVDTVLELGDSRELTLDVTSTPPSRSAEDIRAHVESVCDA